MPEIALAKDAGAPKELHDASLAALATPVLDMDAYVEEFGRSVVPGYRRGVADAEFPADAGLARSIIPPGTSATRDFSGLAPRIPRFIAEACVGCMACVSACPDNALLATVQPATTLPSIIGGFAEREPDPERAIVSANQHFARTTKYGEVPARRGLEPGAFGLFVDPVHCKGCAECVEVCDALGHGAIRMIDKEPASATSLRFPHSDSGACTVTIRIMIRPRVRGAGEAGRDVSWAASRMGVAPTSAEEPPTLARSFEKGTCGTRPASLDTAAGTTPSAPRRPRHVSR